MVDSLKETKVKPKYTEYAKVGHYCWDRAYRDEELVTWLFKQSKTEQSKTVPKK